MGGHLILWNRRCLNCIYSHGTGTLLSPPPFHLWCLYKTVTVLNAIVKMWVRKCPSDGLVSTLEQVKQECVGIPLYISIAWIISKWSGNMPLLSFLPTQKEKTRSFLMPVLWTCYHKLGVVFKELFVYRIVAITSRFIALADNQLQASFPI